MAEFIENLGLFELPYKPSVTPLNPSEKPDHDTLATFRRRFLDELTELIVQVLAVAHESIS